MIILQNDIYKTGTFHAQIPVYGLFIEAQLMRVRVLPPLTSTLDSLQVFVTVLISTTV